MSFFWPTYSDPDPSALGRLGRVCHWTALIAGAALGTFGVLAFDGTNEPGAWLAAAIFAGAVGMLGRGLRYILAGE